MITLIIVSSVLAYLGLSLFTARVTFQRSRYVPGVRRHTYPRADTPGYSEEGYGDWLIEPQNFKNKNEDTWVFGMSMIWGLGWPVTGLLMVANYVVTANLPEYPAEKELALRNALKDAEEAKNKLREMGIDAWATSVSG